MTNFELVTLCSGVMKALHENGIAVENYKWLELYGDYLKTCKTDEQRASYVEETLCDPDGDPTDTLACFEAKMCNAEIQIYWERML